MTVTEQGDLLIAEPNTDSVCLWTCTGERKHSYDLSFCHPSGVAMLRNNGFLVVNGNNQQIIRFNVDTPQPLAHFDFPQKNHALNFPGGMAVTLDNRTVVVIADFDSCRIVVCDTEGHEVQPFINVFAHGHPWGVALSPDETMVAVTFWDPHHVGIYRLGDGALLHCLGAANIGCHGHFHYPLGILWCKDGILVVADAGNGRILVFSPTGKGFLWNKEPAVFKIPREDPDPLPTPWPSGLALLPDGRLAVLSYKFNRSLVDGRCVVDIFL